MINTISRAHGYVREGREMNDTRSDVHVSVVCITMRYTSRVFNRRTNSRARFVAWGRQKGTAGPGIERFTLSAPVTIKHECNGTAFLRCSTNESKPPSIAINRITLITGIDLPYPST